MWGYSELLNAIHNQNYMKLLCLDLYSILYPFRVTLFFSSLIIHCSFPLPCLCSDDYLSFSVLIIHYTFSSPCVCSNLFLSYEFLLIYCTFSLPCLSTNLWAKGRALLFIPYPPFQDLVLGICTTNLEVFVSCF